MSDLDQIRHERNLLGQALGDVLVAVGMIESVSLTGPELLVAAEDFVRRVNAGASGLRSGSGPAVNADTEPPRGSEVDSPPISTLMSSEES